MHLIAESDLNDVQVLDPHDKGGYGIDAQWSDDFHHAVHALLTGERTSYYSDFGRPEQVAKALNQHFVYDGVYSPFRGRRHGSSAGSHAPDRFVNAIQNHDQIGNRAARVIGSAQFSTRPSSGWRPDCCYWLRRSR